MSTALLLFLFLGAGAMYLAALGANLEAKSSLIA